MVDNNSNSSYRDRCPAVVLRPVTLIMAKTTPGDVQRKVEHSHKTWGCEQLHAFRVEGLALLEFGV